MLTPICSPNSPISAASSLGWSEEVARYLFRRVVSWGRSSNVFLRNGARLYLDVGSHPEYATPECDSINELVAHDKAGERILEQLLASAEQRLGAHRRQRRPTRRLVQHVRPQGLKTHGHRGAHPGIDGPRQVGLHQIVGRQLDDAVVGALDPAHRVGDVDIDTGTFNAVAPDCSKVDNPAPANTPAPVAATNGRPKGQTLGSNPYAAG